LHRQRFAAIEREYTQMQLLLPDLLADK